MGIRTSLCITRSQKNFIHYTKKIKELIKKNKLPGENFYKKLIANAILFKTVDKLFGRKNVDAIGDTNLKSFTVAYTVSYFHHLTNNCLDLWKVYEEQMIDNTLMNFLKELLVFVYQNFINEASNTLISEYAKRESSWKKLKDTVYAPILLRSIEPYLISVEERNERENEKEIDRNSTEENIFVISEIQKMGLRFWDGFMTFISQKKSPEFDFILAFDLLKKLKEQKNLTSREIAFGRKVLEHIYSNPSLIEEIKSFSKLEDAEIVEIKFMYDKLLLLSKDDWKRIIELATQTKIFNNRISKY